MWLDRYRDKERAKANAKRNGERTRAKHREVILAKRREKIRVDPVHAAKLRTESLQRSRGQRAKVAALKAPPCTDCHRQFPPECMDFDHRDGEVKTATISQLIGHGLDRILAEIAKCDLICANCHRRRTYRRRRSRG